MTAVQVQFTIDDVARGETIVGELLDARVVACAQTLGPITSRYWWRGSLDEAQEWLFVCKTTSDLLADVVDRIRARHPYEVPEIVATEITGGLDTYLAWIGAATQPPPATAHS